MNKDKLLGAIALCRKAGALYIGFDPVKDNTLSGKTALVLTASDISPKTLKRVNMFCENIVRVMQLPLTQFEISSVTVKPAAVLGVADYNLVKLIEKNLQEEQYGSYNL